jgi:GT2 family glycosyltransferase
VDQSDDSKTKYVIKQLQSNKIRYFKSHKKGKTRGLNAMIRIAKYEILAFTDDDCVVGKNWLQEINTFYKNHPHSAGVFGNVFPYKPYLHTDKFCTSTFTSRRISKQNDPYKIHWHVLGIGNNMSLRKSVVKKINYFREWLGPGSIALNGDETDLIFRILSKEYTLMTNPHMIVYHNRWLTSYQLIKLLGTYSCGMSAVYAYYLFYNGDKNMTTLIKKEIKTYIYPPFSDYGKSIYHFQFRQLFYKRMRLFTGFWELYCFLKGFSIGSIIGIKDYLYKNNVIQNLY